MDEMRHQLFASGYVHIPGLITPETARSIVDDFRNTCGAGDTKDGILKLNDSTDRENVLYSSRRSKLKYCYLHSKKALETGMRISSDLTSITGVQWGRNIDTVALPIFEYELGGFIKEHRDRDIGYGPNNYICTILLTEPAVDFAGGRFFLNEYVEVSDDGKEVFSEDISKRVYFEPKIGSGIVFFNPRFIHGTEPVTATKDGRAIRITTSFRSS